MGENQLLIHLNSRSYKTIYAEVDILKECIKELKDILDILRNINEKAYDSFRSILFLLKEKRRNLL